MFYRNEPEAADLNGDRHQDPDASSREPRVTQFLACQYCHGFLSFSAALVRPLCGFETVILDLLQVILNGMNELFSQLDGTGGPIGYAIFWVFCDNNSNI